ncbi:MAG: UDP-4-amino-4,6-dideoxy-N-acetyl-beta-L-altrosamine transaminase, partial [Gammaproteobacteria bacterium]|nr:UDP-4-amino-4,6-dideoxy-N-acetyl-beta-L-altrosamine transaminase [Gammaproteobacteria bacterium]
LHLACLVLGLGEGDWLWTTPITFVASANCGRYCGALVDFVDVDSASSNISIEALEKKLIQAELMGCLPKVLVVVHLAGLSCDMEKIQALAKQYRFAIIEDASHALGGRYQGEPVGSGRYSDITVFSFHPVKNMTTAEGGMALTNGQELAERMRLLRGHGITREQRRMDQEADGPWYYQQIELGFNYRMSDLHAVLGVSQLQRLDQFIAQRAVLADRYGCMLADLPLLLPQSHGAAAPAWHLYVVRLQEEGMRAEVVEWMRGEGVMTQVHYIPLHTQPYYRQFGFQEGDFPEAEKYYRKCLTLPIYVELTKKEQDKIVALLGQALGSIE